MIHGPAGVGSFQVDVPRVSRSFTGDLDVEMDQRLSPEVARLLGERLGQGHPLQLSAGSTRAPILLESLPGLTFRCVER